MKSRPDARLYLRHRRPRLSRLRPLFQRARRRLAPFELCVAQTVLDARLETRWRDFDNSDNLPNNDLRTGAQTRLGATYSYYFTPGFVVTTQLYGQREDAEVGFWADWEIAYSGGFAWTFDNPLWQARYPWTLQVGGGVIKRDYDDPDPTINPLEAEEDTQWWTRGALVLPVGRNLGSGPAG